MSSFATPGPIAATVQVAGAHVRVTAGDRTDTVVLVEPRNTASRLDVKVAERTNVEFADGRLSVRTTVSGDKDGSIDITIDLPTSSSLVAHLGNSGVDVTGSLGACEPHVAKGRAQLGRIDALKADIADGEVVIGHIARGATIEGGAVDLRIDEVVGPVGLTSAGGRTWIGHAHADVELSSGTGSVSIDRADGNVSAETGGGVIRIGRLSRGRARLLNASENIEVGISAGTAASVDAESTKGTVHDTVTSRPGAAALDDAASPDDEVTVYARTRHGDVIVRPA